MKTSPTQIIGWREWLSLPELKVKWIKAKLDTGARTSSLHADDLAFIRKGKQSFVRFIIHPLQRTKVPSITAEAKILDHRVVKSSNGKEELRPVIMTPVSLFGQTWPIEITLSSRDNMGFRMLLGRQAIKHHFLLDAGRSFIAGRPKRIIKRK